MVSEVVMYQSMFVLGILMFGFFTVTFNNYTDFAEAITIDSNMERVLQEIGNEILNLINRGRSLKGNGGQIEVNIQIGLESEYAGQSYSINVTTIKGSANLIAYSENEVFAQQPLGFLSGPDAANGEISFSGRLASGDMNPKITYIWDGTSIVEALVFS